MNAPLAAGKEENNRSVFQNTQRMIDNCTPWGVFFSTPWSGWSG